MVDVEGVRVKLDGDDAGLDRALRRASGRMENFSDQAVRVGKAVAGVTAASAALAAGALRLTQSLTGPLDAMGKAAQTAGVTTDQIQELRFAFGQLAGTTDRDVDLALQRFNRRLGLARQGATEYVKAFDSLNVTLSQDTPQALDAALRAIAQIEDGADRAALASKIFGEEAGPRLAGALAGGIESVAALRRQIRDEGGVIDESAIRKAEAFNDQMDRLSKIVTADLANTLMDHADGLTAIAEGFAAISKFALGAVASVAEFSGNMGQALALMQASASGVSDSVLNDTVAQMAGVGGGAGGTPAASGGSAPPSINPSVQIAGAAPAINPSLGPLSTFRREDQIGIFGEGDEFLAGAGLSDSALDKIRERMAEREALEKEHLEELERLRKASMTDLERFTESSFRDQAKTVADQLANMTASVAQENKAMFALNKAAGISSAVINTAEGVTKALSAYPPPLSFAMAAAQAAAGAAQISAIASTPFGGGTAPSVGATPAPAVTPVTNGAPGGGVGGSGEGGGPTQTLTVSGISDDALFTGSRVRALAEQLLEYQRDGGQVVFQEA
jgi:hypothetical protein